MCNDKATLLHLRIGIYYISCFSKLACCWWWIVGADDVGPGVCGKTVPV